MVVANRAGFWQVLAEEEGRQFSVVIGEGDLEVGLGEDAIAAVVDTIIENVFSHTEPGTAFEVEVRDGAMPVLEVRDAGRGFTTGEAVNRGVSGGGSTGLGLDITRRSAELSGGGLELSDRPGGGAVVRVWFGRG